MSTISVTLPDKLKQSVEELAKKENLSTDEFISMTLSEKVTQVDELQYLQLRAAKGSREAFLKLLKKAPDVPPEAGDEK
jgi:hypothetical protein